MIRISVFYRTGRHKKPFSIAQLCRVITKWEKILTKDIKFLEERERASKMLRLPSVPWLVFLIPKLSTLAHKTKVLHLAVSDYNYIFPFQALLFRRFYWDIYWISTIPDLNIQICSGSVFYIELSKHANYLPVPQSGLRTVHLHSKLYFLIVLNFIVHLSGLGLHQV